MPLLIAKILGRDPVDGLWLVLPAIVKGGNNFEVRVKQVHYVNTHQACPRCSGVIEILIVVQVVGK